MAVLEVCELDQRGLVGAIEPANFKSDPGVDDIGSESFLDSLENTLNLFRLPKGGYYRDLRGAERAALPSVEEQVCRLEDEISCWIGHVVSDAAEIGFSPENEQYAADRIQVQQVCDTSGYTRSVYEYWECNYDARPTNASGRFVQWATNRMLRGHINQAVEEILVQEKSARQDGTLFSQAKVDFSVIARRSDIRMTAYQARTHAKIGLACMRVVTPERSRRLEEYFQRTEENPTKETVDLMGLLTSQEAIMRKLQLPWHDINAAVEEMPF